MSKTRTTLTIDEDVLKMVKVRAAREGKGESEIIEEAVRQRLGLDLFEKLWQRNTLDESQAMALALQAQHSAGKRSTNK